MRSQDVDGEKLTTSLTNDIEDAQRFGPREATDVTNMVRESGLIVALEEVPPRDL